jgi:hypothetical protein
MEGLTGAAICGAESGNTTSMAILTTDRSENVQVSIAQQFLFNTMNQVQALLFYTVTAM